MDTASLPADKKADYLKILKLLNRMRPQFDHKDKHGRTCLHHAAAAGNIIGLEFTRDAMNYWFEKENETKIPEGEVCMALHELAKVRTTGGATALMQAAESGSFKAVKFFLQIGSDPLASDNLGRTALDHAKMAHLKDMMLKVLEKAEHEECDCPV